jgi:hypothetical protein
MSEDIYTPYEEGEWKKRFEMTIPILLLILVLVVVGWKTGALEQIPFINMFFKGPTDILIIGYDANLIREMDTNIKTDLPVNYIVRDKSYLENASNCQFVNDYDAIILTEGQDGDTIALPRFALECIRNGVNSGKTAIVIKRAGSEVTGSSQEDGWGSGNLGFVPVISRMGVGQPFTNERSYDSITLMIRDPANSILQNFKDQPLTFTSQGQSSQIEYTEVNPTGGGVSILDMKVDYGAESITERAMVESNSLGHRVIYFTFDPTLYPPLLYNTIKSIS